MEYEKQGCKIAIGSSPETPKYITSACEASPEEVRVFAFLFANPKYLAQFNTAGLQGAITSPGGRSLCRLIGKAGDAFSERPRMLFDLAPPAMIPLLNDLFELADLVYSESASMDAAELLAWISRNA